MPSNAARKPLTPSQGQLLLELARGAIAAELGIEQEQTPHPAENKPVLTTHRSTFVTLKKAGALRGCIGSLAANQPLVENVRANALNAAFHDPRFSPLTAEEWPLVNIEVSVLTKPRILVYGSGEELPDLLTPHVDGIVIRKGLASSTFLPQVWRQLPRPQDFLAHLCLKAGLSADAWREGDLEVETYQVQSFEEGSTPQ